MSILGMLVDMPRISLVGRWRRAAKECGKRTGSGRFCTSEIGAGGARLARRGDPKGMSWERMHKLLAFFYIPEARVVHSIYAAKP